MLFLKLCLQQYKWPTCDYNPLTQRCQLTCWQEFCEQFCYSMKIKVIIVFSPKSAGVSINKQPKRAAIAHLRSSWGNKFCTQGRITPKWIIRSGPNSNSFELLCLSSLSASLTNIWSEVSEKSWRHHFITTQGHITPKLLVRSGWN